MASSRQASATIFLVLRRMRAPLIVLIVIFAVSTLGLTLIPGQDAAGPAVADGLLRRLLRDELHGLDDRLRRDPVPVHLQPAHVGHDLDLPHRRRLGLRDRVAAGAVQERSFRQALALQHFTRKVGRLREPFLLIIGYGRTGELLGRSLDALGRRFVVIDRDDDRIDDLYLDSYHADVPGLVPTRATPVTSASPGLGHPFCEGVLALTDDDEANLAVDP